MANEWQSQLPSAWKPQNPNEQVQAAKTGAETIAATAQAGQTAVAAEAANQERIRKQALQDIMAQSIDTKIGPDGRARHEFNNDKFLGLLKTNPAAADAYDVWHTKINPANATAATQRAMAGATTAEGGLSAADLAKSAQGSEYAGQILAAGRGIQQAQAETGTNVAANRFAQGQMGTGTTAQPGSLLYNEQVQPKAIGAGATGAGQIDETAVSKLSKSGREAALYNLKAKGVVLPPNASAADIAAAANRVADAQVAAQSVQGADLQKPVSLATSAFQTAASEPAIRQKVYGDIFGGALDVIGKKIGVASAGMNLAGAQAGQARTQDVATSLRIPANRVGNSTTQVTQDKIDQANQAVNAFGGLKATTADIQRKIARGEINPNTPAGNKLLVAEVTAMLGQLQTIYGGSGTEGSVGRALKDVGAPADVLGAAEHGLEAAAAAWVANKAANIPDLLAHAPDRALPSVRLALQSVYSSDPDGVLKERGYLPKGLSPSAFPAKTKTKPKMRVASDADIDAMLKSGGKK